MPDNILAKEKKVATTHENKKRKEKKTIKHFLTLIKRKKMVENDINEAGRHKTVLSMKMTEHFLVFFILLVVEHLQLHFGTQRRISWRKFYHNMLIVIVNNKKSFLINLMSVVWSCQREVSKKSCRKAKRNCQGKKKRETQKHFGKHLSEKRKRNKRLRHATN